MEKLDISATTALQLVHGDLQVQDASFARSAGSLVTQLKTAAHVHLDAGVTIADVLTTQVTVAALLAQITGVTNAKGLATELIVAVLQAQTANATIAAD